MARAAKTTQETNRKVEFKSFKTTSEVENFYRFVFDNGLRSEAKKLIEYVLEKTSKKKKRKPRKAKTLH
jgi:hypothetical protein